MTHHDQSNASHPHFQSGAPATEVVQFLSEHGFEGKARAIEILTDEAMKLQRNEALRAAPWGAKPGHVVLPLRSSERSPKS